MNEEQSPGIEPVDEDGGQGTEERTSEAETTTTQRQQTTESPEPAPAGEPPAEEMGDEMEQTEEQAKSIAGEAPVDWFEPLEEDDEGLNDLEEESLAGETESLVGSDFKRVYQLSHPRRKRSHPDEGWIEWPDLGDGWKRKEVVRRSGSSIGQKDVYYLSPRGDRVRSRVELATVLEGILDISNFEYKTGKFYNGEPQPLRIRNRSKKRVHEYSSSESSWMERGEGADTPDSHHRLTPSQWPKTSYSMHSSMGTSSNDPFSEDIKLPLPSSSRSHPLPAINGEIGSEENTLICARCGISFTGTWYDKQRKRPSCPSCWASKTKEHPMIRFRKWIPCGQCVGCHNTVNCGQCANCKHGLQSPESRKRICRKRKCICPIRKGPGSGGVSLGVGGGFTQKRPYNDLPDLLDDSMSYQFDEHPLSTAASHLQHPSLKSSDTENFSLNVDVDDEDDMSTDDDDDWHKKRKRRSCGECKACLCRKDCGTCDFCIDKPKFGGSNKKRQKCRLRQCQRQAMRHLLPFQMAQGDYGADNPLLPGRPRPHYTYSRKTNMKKIKTPQVVMEFTDNEDDDSNLQAMSWSSEPAGGSKHAYEIDLSNQQQSSMQVNHLDFRVLNGLSDRGALLSNHNSSHQDQHSRWDGHKSYLDSQKYIDEEEDLPMITQIYSLADNPIGSDHESQLMKLLNSIRNTSLPILWYAIMVDGPQLQLIQCSKQSNMADTIVLIDPGFFFQVTVQKQPLLPTHPLYDDYPARLTSVTDVVSLLLGLEKYVVCQGLPPREPNSCTDPITLERASTCDFLVKKKVRICYNCRELCELGH
ncbi:uncharacterized protein ACBR49_010411 [Aulostomus maculatus]